MSVLSSRVDSAFEILNPYLKRDKLLEALKKLGINDDDLGLKLLDTVVEENDFIEAINEVIISYETEIPKPIMRAAWKILKGEDPFKKPEVPKVSSINELANTLKPVPQWSDEELLRGYGKDCLPTIEDELRKRTCGRPCIIYQDDNNTINIQESLRMIRNARRQMTPKSFIVNGVLRRLYAVGDYLVEIFDECPIHSHILLVEGYCEECGITWDLSEKNRTKLQFIRLIAERKKTIGISDFEIRDKISLNFQELQKIFPKIWEVYKDMEEEGSLPHLRKRGSKDKKGDPFNVVHKII